MKNQNVKLCYGIAIMIILVTFSAGCTTATVTASALPGKYVSTKNADESIELSSDGTFYYMTSRSSGYHGKWDTSGDLVRLNIDMLGATVQLKHKDNSLVLSNNYGTDTVFVRQ